jgi:hypothetical protein
LTDLFQLIPACLFRVGACRGAHLSQRLTVKGFGTFASCAQNGFAGLRFVS